MNSDPRLEISCVDNVLTITIPEDLYCAKFDGKDKPKTSKPISIYYAVKIDDALEMGNEKIYENKASMA